MSSWPFSRHEQLAASYAFADQTPSLMRQSNPVALRAITERLLEAPSRTNRRRRGEPDPPPLA
jgi:cobalamin biosynthesis Mg chelatase CobN